MFKARLSELRRRFVLNEKGNVGIVFAVATLPLVAATGAAIDYTRAADMRTKLQSSLDAAVLNGLRAAGTERQSVAETSLRGSIPPQTATIGSLAFEPTVTGGLRGNAVVRMPSMFGGILGNTGIQVGAAAEAYTKKSAPPSAKACLLLMDPSMPEALRVNGGAIVKAPNCEVHVHSSAPVAAVFNGTSQFLPKRLCIKGSGYTATGNTDVRPVETSCAVVTDPFANTIPTPADASCTYTNKKFDAPKGTTLTLSPGVYCGETSFNGEQIIHFSDGLYVIKGGTMTIGSGSTITGQNVTLFFASAEAGLQINGSTSTTLSAPTTGAYAGVLMAEPTGLARSNIALNGSSGHKLEGLLYLPSRNVTFNGASTIANEHVTMVFNSLLFNGSSNMTFDTASKNIPVPTGPEKLETVLLY